MRKQLQEKVDLLSQEKHIPRLELYFIEEALNAVIVGKKSLSNTYIFGFYLKNGKSKEFFEFTQGFLEKNADELNYHLESAELSHLTEINNYKNVLLSK